MPQAVEVPGLSKADAQQRAEDFSIDGIPVEILPQPDGTFTVRATYPDDVEIPGVAAPAQAAAQPARQNPAQPQATRPAPLPSAVPGAGTGIKISQKGAALIKSFESCLQPIPGGYQAYLDPVHVLTIGWGHTNDNGTQFNASSVWTQAQCDTEFLSDMAIFERAVSSLITVPLNQNQFDALVSFTFNVGKGNLAQSTLLKKLNAGDYAGAAQEFPRWNKASGKVLAGLTRRRVAEAQLFQSTT